jgi:D-apiose dehydrogenase
VSFAARPIQCVAVIGAGYFSQFHLHGWKSMPGIEIVAVCDADEDKAVQSAQQFGALRSVSSTQALFDLPGIDLLDIVTPPSSHQALVVEALSQGIATICQKPFATHYAQACELAELSEQRGIPLIVHENFRFMPWYREMKRLLATGLLGKLHNIAFRLRTGDGQGADAYLARQPYFQKMPRLLVAETAVHFIDTFRHLCGEIKSVSAHLRRLNPHIAGEDAAHIIFEFDHGVAGSFDGNRLNDHVADNPRTTFGEMWLEGEYGVLRLDGNAQLYFKPHQGTEKQLSYKRGSDVQFGGGACQALQEHVVSCLRSGQTPENTARDYLRNLLIQEAVYASHVQGRRIEIASFVPPALPENPFHPLFSTPA